MKRYNKSQYTKIHFAHDLAPELETDELRKVCELKDEEFCKWAESRGGHVARANKEHPKLRGAEIHSSWLEIFKMINA